MLGTLQQAGAPCAGLRPTELKSRIPVRPGLSRKVRSLKVKAVAEPPTLPQEIERGLWRPESWRQFKAHQQPKYPDAQALQGAVGEITNLPPLVFAGECRNLQAKLARCAAGEAFLLQGICVALQGINPCNRGSSIVLAFDVILRRAGEI